MAVLAAAMAVLAFPAATTATAEPRETAAECQWRGQNLNFGMWGMVEITVCPYEGTSWPEVIARTTNFEHNIPLYGFTRITGSNGLYYRGDWHRHGAGTDPFNEGLNVNAPHLSGDQYCAQFFKQETRTSPVTEFSTPVCVTVP